MGKKKCASGFHGSLHEDLTSDVCKECGRNYINESFLRACKGLGIPPEEVVGEKIAKKIKDSVSQKKRRNINNGKRIIAS
jgi:hypothetical protein